MYVMPIFSVGLRMNDDVVRIAVSFHLGIPVSITMCALTMVLRSII